MSASFGGTNQLTGRLSRTPIDAGITHSLGINADIAGNGSFAGSALANDLTHGATQGQFFGAQASALAGVATFAGHKALDTAFAGSKN